MATEGQPGLQPALSPPDARPALALLLLVTALTCTLGWLFKANCTFDGYWDNLEFYTKGCYSDAYPFWRGKGLADGAIPYFETPVEYPVLTGLLIFLEQRWTHAMFGADAGDPAFVFVVSLVNTGLALIVTRLLWGLNLSKWRLWAWALSPMLILYVGHNWDLLAVTLALGAFVAAQRGRMIDATALAALGVAAKLFPAVLLPLLALRRFLQGRIGEVLMLVAVAIGVWLAVNLPVMAFATDNWWEFYKFSSERAGTRAAVWDLLHFYGLFETDIAMRNKLSLLVFIAGMWAILANGWERDKDRLWLLFPPVVLWFLLSSKVYSPQFDIWAWPLVLIAARRWQPVALFALGDIAAYFAEFWFFSAQEGGWPAMPMEAILIAALIRAGAMIWLIFDMVRLPLPRWLESAAQAPPRSSLAD